MSDHLPMRYVSRPGDPEPESALFPVEPSGSAGAGRCRRPLPGPVLGHLVNRVAAADVDALTLTDPHLVVDCGGDEDAGVPWRVGDVVDVYPVRGAATRCGRCWACRLQRLFGR